MESRDDRLGTAANTKEMGNDMYKSGKFEDARKCYNQVLDLLTSQTSLTSGEKEKRDNLVLTAHLNLAACELKLGDNAKIIQHCSLALQMNKESLKAYFRRGQAYHNNKDYDLALKDYLEAERLEPQNPEIRKQEEKLLADKMEACVRVADQGTLDCASEDCHEVVMMFEDDEEADLRDYEKRCHKAARHSEYIPVSYFCLEHLPEQYRTEAVLGCVRALITSTVLLKVRGSSSKRPEFVPGTTIEYPFSGPRYRKTIRYGSGCVVDVLVYPECGKKVCPCDTCKSSGKPKTQFAEICVKTAAHVIFDYAEGRKSTCYFDYDSDQTDLNSCQKLSTAVDMISNAGGDLSQVHFVTHDLQFAKKLFDPHLAYFRFCRQLKLDIGLIRNEDEEKVELSVKFSNLYEKFQDTIKKLNQWIDNLKKIINGDAKRLWEDYVRKYNLKPGEEIPSLYGGALFDTVQGGNKCEHMLRLLYTWHEVFVGYNKEIQEMTDNFEAKLDQYGHQSMLEKYEVCRDGLIKIHRVMQTLLDEPDGTKAHGSSSNEHLEKNLYDSSHPFTVIVSHPHGLGKKISLGEVTGRKVGIRYDLASYQYTNTTCPGSSGAPVFIMGMLGVNPPHPHSKMVQVQINESGFSMDW